MDSINSIQTKHKSFQFVSPPSSSSSSSSFSALQLVLEMARNGVVSWKKRFGKTESGCCDSFPTSDSDEVHVLAVDDSLIDRTVIERLLKISSCKVTAVDSGRRALQYLGLDDETSSSDDYDGLKVDMIITDYCMPGMTGFELLKKIKESSTLREIPVVIMSSENILARIDRCLEEGAEDYIVKPVKLSDVVRLRDYMKRDSVNEHSSSNGDHKRKVRDFTDVESSSSFISSFSPSKSSSSCSSSSVPYCPPTSLDSPIGRLKMTTTTTTD